MLMWTGGFTIALFLAELMFFTFNPDNPDAALMNISQFSGIFIVIGLSAGACTFLSDYNKKAKRETFLMLPASNLEKFLVAVFHVVFVYTIALFLSVVLGDTLRMVYRAIAYGDEWQLAIPLIVDYFYPNILDAENMVDGVFWYAVTQMAVFVAMILWIHSVYTLGGTLLRKYSFVVVSLFIITCIVAFVKFMIYYKLSMFQTNWEAHNGHATLVYYDAGVMSYVLIVVLPILSVFNYWVSYHIFKNYQLITNKWINYDFHKR
jgi:hypothetical protein